MFTLIDKASDQNILKNILIVNSLSIVIVTRNGKVVLKHELF